MRNMDNSFDEYRSANDDSFANTSIGVTSPTATAVITPTMAARKQLSPADPNEPAKPLSAYALFFRDTVSVIKQENPKCTFPELSRIVASLWEGLPELEKDNYNKQHEIARNEYLRKINAYRQQQQQHQQQQQQINANNLSNNSTPLQTKPAVFTINTNIMSNNQNNTLLRTPQKQPIQNTVATTPAVVQQPTLYVQQEQILSPQQQPQQQQEQIVNAIVAVVPNNNNTTNIVTAEATATPTDTSNANAAANIVVAVDTSVQQTEKPMEVTEVQMCIRDGCNKRAIVNADWEDEYCSNECVVIHCRNVFNEWVASNKNEIK